MEAYASKGAGRPVVMTEGARLAYLAALEAGNTRMASAGLAGVSYSSAVRLIKADETFAQAVFEAECRAEAFYLSIIQAAAREGNAQSAQWWAERRRPQQYGRQERLTVLRDVARDVSALSDEELALLAYGDDANEGEGPS